jgi:hypothetical protein
MGGEVGKSAVSGFESINELMFNLLLLLFGVQVVIRLSLF